MIEIKYIEIESLQAYKNNSKTHPDTQIAQIQSSIREYGFCEPVLIDENNTILSGHARIQALKDMGEIEAPTICLEQLTDTQKKKAVIIFNKVQENSDWYTPNLVLDLKSILSEEPHSDLKGLGFSSNELELLLSEVNFDFTDDEYEPEDLDQYQSVIIQYVLIFDDEDQQGVWTSHLKHLKQQYPQLLTHSSRISQFIRDNSEKT
jgi:ParB-like chromosome segregation protein Spo0J